MHNSPALYRGCVLALSSPVLLLIAACSPLDLPKCEGMPGTIDSRLSGLARAHVKEAVVTEQYVLALSNCWSEDSADQQRAACSRAIDTDQLSTGDRVFALDCRGNRRLADGDVDGAIADYSEAIRLDPYNADLYSDRGSALTAKGTVEAALADFDRAIALQPKFMSRRYDIVYANRAAAWLKKGDYDKAIADVNWAMGYESRPSVAFANRALAWSRKGEPVKAMDDFDAAIRLSPKIPMYYVLRGNERAKAGDRDLAISDYGEAIRQDAKLVLAYVRRAQMWQAKGDAGRAAEDRDEAIRLEPRLKDRWPSDQRKTTS
jgi:tetratricopeptide (TPR) repeat protein